MSSANKTLAYLTLDILTLALMLVFVWNHASHGNVSWTVTFAALASLNASLAGANIVVWLTERNEK